MRRLPTVTGKNGSGILQSTCSSHFGNAWVHQEERTRTLAPRKRPARATMGSDMDTFTMCRPPKRSIRIGWRPPPLRRPVPSRLHRRALVPTAKKAELVGVSTLPTGATIFTLIGQTAPHDWTWEKRYINRRITEKKSTWEYKTRIWK